MNSSAEIIQPYISAQPEAGTWPPFAPGKPTSALESWKIDSSVLGKSAYSTLAFGDKTGQIGKRLAELRNPPAPSSFADQAAGRTIEETLFDATASAKILTSYVAMHLAAEWRTRLFRQLDDLLDPQEWEDGDRPLQVSSFATFLKAIIALRPVNRPGLGLSVTGHLITAWTSGQNRLTFEFLHGDQVRWVLRRYFDDELVTASGTNKVERLADMLKPYSPEIWFG